MLKLISKGTFKLMRRDHNLLFSELDLRISIEAQGQKLIEEIDSIDANRLLNTNPDGLIAYFEQKYCVNVPKIDDATIQVNQVSTQVDVSHDTMRVFMDKSRPYYIEGTKITYYVPYEGDKELFHCRPSTFNFNPPRAEVNDNEVLFVYEITDHNAEAVKNQFERDLKEVKEWLSWIDKDVIPFNAQLKGKVGGRIMARREKLIKDQGLAAGLGFPLRRREESPKTYVVPTVKRKITQVMPPQGTTPFVPEPTLEIKEYEHILAIISDMAKVIERSPNAFKTMGEEDIRQHFLVQLNGQYEGQATGETFNFEGKTDILIREKGKNIFIAECKFWHGPEEFKKAIDQLLGYATWRDSKLAILIFNRGTALTTVLQKIPEVVKAHPNFVKQIDFKSETGFRFTMKHKDDPQRDLTLTVMVFEVPV
jgi:hypothetical protein